MSSTAPPERAPIWRRVLARVALIGGLGLAASWFLPSLPREQDLVFRVGATQPVRSLDVSFTLEGQRVPQRGVTLRFADKAPATIRHQLSLPNGRYDVRISIVRELPDGPKETMLLRRVTLEGGETAIPLENAP